MNGRWWHSIDLGGEVTPGAKPPELLDWEWRNLGLDVAGKTVLDIGANDGYFSFRAEAEGAARVVALDVWELGDTNRRHVRSTFDYAHERLGSAVEPVQADFMTADLEKLGKFDIVLFLGVLYHMPDPLTAMRRLRQVTGGVACIETEAIRLDSGPLFQFVRSEWMGDHTNWWIPNEAGVSDMVLAAGFNEATPVAETKTRPRYRLTIKAR